jgi:hypothetical protein
MEVIGHQAVRKNAAASEFLAHAHQHPEMLALLLPQQESAPYDPTNRMVDFRFLHRILPRCDPSPTIVSAHLAPIFVHIAARSKILFKKPGLLNGAQC